MTTFGVLVVKHAIRCRSTTVSALCARRADVPLFMVIAVDGHDVGAARLCPERGQWIHHRKPARSTWLRLRRAP